MWGFCDSKYHWFIQNIISVKFDFAMGKVYEIIKNVILPVFVISKSAVWQYMWHDVLPHGMWD